MISKIEKPKTIAFPKGVLDDIENAPDSGSGKKQEFTDWEDAIILRCFKNKTLKTITAIINKYNKRHKGYNAVRRRKDELFAELK